MKSYNHLYEICISETNRREGIKAAKHSKRIRHIIKERHLSDDALLDLSYEWIVNFQKMKRYSSKYSRFDESRIYLKLACLYTGEGGNNETELLAS